MKHRRLSDLAIFLLCLGILAGCLIMTPPENDSPFLRIGNIQLPGMCTFRSVTGIPCPGCGLFRSMVTAVHGNIAKSWEFHRLGFLTILYVICQFLFRSMMLLFPDLKIRFFRLDSYLNRGMILLAVLFGINWIVTLLEWI